MDRKFTKFDNKVWRKICEYNMRYNNELCDMTELVSVTSFIKGQRIQWLGYIMEKEKKNS